MRNLKPDLSGILVCPYSLSALLKISLSIFPYSGIQRIEWQAHTTGFSHVRAALLKPGISVPLLKGKMTLGTWQQIVLIDFDNNKRKRSVVVQILGE